jgi:hypothetical protein
MVAGSVCGMGDWRTDEAGPEKGRPGFTSAWDTLERLLLEGQVNVKRPPFTSISWSIVLPHSGGIPLG